MNSQQAHNRNKPTTWERCRGGYHLTGRRWFGLEETLTITRLGLSPALVKTFRSTNPIESLNDGIRVMEHNVKNWQSGTMTLRWTAAATLEREKRFRRLNGYRDLWLLKRALDDHTKEVTSSNSAA